ncbi:MAG: glutamine synthetase beta-grasp domain-containing protein [Opitutales bacterium]
MTKNILEYLWIDGSLPVENIRSKARIANLGNNVTIDSFPEWSFDGSSTNQADGGDSDCILKPVNFVKDPIRGEGNYLVMCEVFNADGTSHKTNIRRHLVDLLESGAKNEDPWVGFEQEYTLFENNNQPFKWPTNGYPGPQGPYYCGAGADKVAGRDLVEEHFKACIDAGIMIYGINAEVMPAQWEFQIGYRGIEGEDAGILNVSDHIWIARWLLSRLAEKHNIIVSFDNKPIKGDWNGAGLHTNFSTTDIRDPKKGLQAIEDAMQNLEKRHAEHIAVYGHNLHERLTGLHETSGIEEFSYGNADRGCSIRIPRPVQLKGCGYFEDRRPGANSNPYSIAYELVNTVCFQGNKSALAA